MLNHLNGKRFKYGNVTHHKTISMTKGEDSIINDSINVPRRSMKLRTHTRKDRETVSLVTVNGINPE